MQTTLLGLAIAIILALVAALVGPLLIDWGGYRTAFEHEASRLIGLPVRVTGPIEARLLPSPQLTLHDIEIGGGGDALRARALGIEFALGPLMRGQWRVSELHLNGPQLRLGLDASGHLQAPKLAVGFNPDALSIDRINIQDGMLTLTDAANGAGVTLEHLWFNGAARSLLGPFNGEGAASVSGELYPFRIAAGRYGGDGKLKLHVNVDPVNHPLSAEADGMLALTGGKPGFDGSLSLTRPVGIASRSTGRLSQPWRVSGKVEVTAARALMPNFAFDYGSQDRGFKLTGVADFKYGKEPRFDGVLSGQQIDLDRTLAGSDTQAPPSSAIGELAELAGGAFRPTIPIQIGIGIDQVTLGGDTIENVRGDISTGAQGWNLDRFEFRAPGYTQVRMSGALAVDDAGVSFTGPAEIKANNPQALAAWLEGRGQTAKGAIDPFSMGGQITLASNEIAVDRLTAQFDRQSIAGRFAYFFSTSGKPARLDAALKASDLDIDQALSFGNALLAGSHFARPHDMTIAADIGHATVAGFAVRNASARLKMDANGLQIDRLSVADLGGATFSASGRIITAPPSPQGSIRVDLNAPDMTPVMALLARFAPKTAQTLAYGAPAMAPAKLHATLSLAGASPEAKAKLAVGGSLGKVQVALSGETTTDLTTFKAGDTQLTGKLSANDGKELLALLGLDRVLAVNAGPGALTFTAGGPPRGTWQVNGKLSAAGLDASADGTAQFMADHPTADLHATILRADAAPLRRGGQSKLPVAFSGHVALTGKELALSDIDASVAGAVLRGKLTMTLAQPHRLQGEIEADRVDGAGLIAATIGMPAPPAGKGAAWRWSSEPFGAGVFGDYAGAIKLKARSSELLPRLTAREFSATLACGKGHFAVENMAGDVAGGHLSGRLALAAADDGLQAQAKFALSGADAAGLLASGARPAVTGTLALSGEIEGSGLSPVALIGSLHGAGKIALADAQFAGLDPRAFDAVTHAVDRGLPIDAARISDVVGKALESGRLSVQRAQGTLAVSAGQVRLSQFSAESKDAKLSLAGNLDLTDGSLDGRLVLSGSSNAAGARPDIFMALTGPVTAPARSIDVSALTGWLTLRAVENQTKQLQEMERNTPQPQAPPPKPKAEPSSKSELTPGKAPASISSAPPPASALAMPAEPATVSEHAPSLPAPVEIGPLPAPGGAAKPEASAGVPQH